MIYNFEVEAITDIREFIENADVSGYEWDAVREHDFLIIKIDLDKDHVFESYAGEDELLIDGERYIKVFWGDTATETYLREDAYDNLFNLYVIAMATDEGAYRARPYVYASVAEAQEELKRVYPEVEQGEDYDIIDESYL